MKKLLVLMFLTLVSFRAFSVGLDLVDRGPTKSIYGPDNRVLVGDSTNETYRLWAESTAAMLPKEAIGNLLEGYSFTSNYKLKKRMNLCKDEKFADQVAVALCSGFLVGKDLLVTAGHCVKSLEDCKNRRWVFDYRADKLIKTDEVVVLPNKNIYRCKKVVSRRYDLKEVPVVPFGFAEDLIGRYFSEEYARVNRERKVKLKSKHDYAVIQLDRAVTDREPLKFRKKGKISNDAELVMIGHPSGLPTVIADGATVRNNKEYYYFKANTDSFAGNSGSAVINADSGEVEGILVRGKTDYKMDPVKKCRVPVKYKNEEGGESVTRITGVPIKGKAFLPTPNDIDSEGNLVVR